MRAGQVVLTRAAVVGLRRTIYGGTESSDEALDTQHKGQRDRESTPRAGEGLRAGVARLGRAALQSQLLELQGALVDVEGVRHDDGVRDALPVVLPERAGTSGACTLL